MPPQRRGAGTAGAEQVPESADPKATDGDGAGGTVAARYQWSKSRRKPSPPLQSNGDEANTNPPPSPPSDDGGSVRLTQLFRLRPWVLVPNGSMKGYFDFLPLAWRVGPWSSAAVAYLALIGTAAVAMPAFCSGYYDIPFSTSSQRPRSPKVTLSEYVGSLQQIEYGAWETHRRDAMYNAGAFLYMLGFAAYLCRTSPLGIRIWSTYTVQSWTMLTLRHLFCAAACVLPANPNRRVVAELRQAFAVLAEITRFPAACSATVTFVVWNAAVMPFLCWKFRADQTRRRGFVKFCFSFRLVNLHWINLPLAYWNAVRASPFRRIGMWDFYAAFVAVVLYMAFYLLVLDRLGVHLYAIFSPRAPTGVVLTTWTLLLAMYVATFWTWRRAMMPPLLS